MAVAQFKTYISGEILTASDFNTSLTNITDNGEDLGWPATKAKDLDGQELILDADADTSITSDTDDRADLRLGGFDAFRFDGTTASVVNGLDFVGTATGVAPYILARGETNIDLQLRSAGTGDVILADDSGNQILIGADVASAVNELTITNAVTTAAPILSATGDDTNIDITLTPKGTGIVKGGPWEQIGATQTASADTSIDFTSGIDSTYRLYAAVLDNVRVVNDAADLLCRFSQASSFKTDAGYNWHFAGQTSSASTYNGAGGAAQTSIAISSSQSFDAAHGFSGTVFLVNPSETVMNKGIYYNGYYFSVGSAHVNVNGSGHYSTSQAAVDGIQFLPDTGTITSGTFTLYGLR